MSGKFVHLKLWMFDLEENSLCLSILYVSFRLLFPSRKCLALSFGKELSLLLVIGTWNLQDDWLVTGANRTWLEGYCLQRERMIFSEASPGVKGVSQQSIIYFQTWWIGWKCSYASDATLQLSSLNVWHIHFHFYWYYWCRTCCLCSWKHSQLHIFWICSSGAISRKTSMSTYLTCANLSVNTVGSGHRPSPENQNLQLWFSFCLIYLSVFQSLLAALGSVQFVSNVGFAYFVLNEKVTGR